MTVIGEIGNALGRITYIGLAATVFTAIVKLLLARWPVPGVVDIFAM